MNGWKSSRPYLESPRHPLIREVRQLLESTRRRRETGRFVVEGVRLVRDALQAGMELERLFVDAGRVVADGQRAAREEEGASGGAGPSPLADLVQEAQRRGAQVVLCSPRALAALSETEHPQGVVAVLRFGGEGGPRWGEQAGLVVLADGLQDPGNVGTLVRVACGAGADGVLLSSDSADPYGSKALRASAGAVFRIAVRRLQPGEELSDEAGRLRREGWEVAALQPRGGRPYYEASLTGRLAVVVGGEGRGIRDEVLRQCSKVLTVPLSGGLESLNAAVAAAVVLFEAARQRSTAARAGVP